jgi:broad specificity phosphatase PhoE
MELWVVRHGETEWSRDLRHTSTTDVPLTEKGERQAAALAPVLVGHEFGLVLCSPLRRAVDTARLAGFPDVQRTELLVEFRYGDYEGRTTAEIREQRPGWELWRDGAPGGETPDQVGGRCDRLLAEIDERDRDVLLFAHNHVLRVLTARYLDLPAADGGKWTLDTGGYAILGHERERRVIRAWNLTPDGRD